MGLSIRPEYDSLDDAPETKGYKNLTNQSETTAGALKHNVSIGIDARTFSSIKEVGQLTAREPESNMANNLLTQVDSPGDAPVAVADDQQLVDALMGKTFDQKPIYVELWQSIRDVFFPPKLPPLELTSKPIPVVDPLAVKANPWAIGISTTVNLSILLVLLFFVGKKIVETVTKPTMMTSIDVGDYNAPRAANKMGGGGGGLGSGNGIGYGPGSGWNTGGGLAQVGGRVSAPVPLFQPEAEFSDEARRAKYQGVCLVGLIVDAQGNPQNVHIVRALGMGLDEKAMEAVRKYKFKPAMRDGKTPVPVYVNVEVNFRLY